MTEDLEDIDRLSILSQIGCIEQNTFILHPSFAGAFLSATRKGRFQIMACILDNETADKYRALTRLLGDKKLCASKSRTTTSKRRGDYRVTMRQR